MRRSDMSPHDATMFIFSAQMVSATCNTIGPGALPSPSLLRPSRGSAGGGRVGTAAGDGETILRAATDEFSAARQDDIARSYGSRTTGGGHSSLPPAITDQRPYG